MCSLIKIVREQERKRAPIMWKAENSFKIFMCIGRPVILSGVLLVQVAFVGCKHSERGSVTGILLHKDGTPLIGARVIGRSDSGKSTYGTTDGNGYFELGVEQKGDGVPTGEYQLMITENRGDLDHPKSASIAAKYNNPNSSGLSIKVAIGDSEKVEFKLDPPP